MLTIPPEELRNASLPQLKSICENLRAEILTTVAQNGGHLSSNMGVAELTVALHHVFDFSRDKIVFDVGHQCYCHKLLTGRGDRFSTLRQRGGLSGFPKREEGDAYETGHAGTAISAALGLAKARDLNGEDYAVVAFVGDGSFNNGLVYEALNSLKILNTNILIILNDNGLSISPTVGGTHAVLDELKVGNAPIEDIRLFERYGLQYAGVFDGNNLETTILTLKTAKEALKTRSVLLHFTTQKGRGHPFCENSPLETHGVGHKNNGTKDYSTALGEELTALAEHNEKIVAVTAAMTDSLGLRDFFDRYPDRAYDVGICEEHASVLCASLAAGGMKPYYAVYSTFLQRSYDEIVHDICGQKLPVTFCIDRAGITGADGETHQGVFDLSFLSHIPNLTIAVPKDLGEFRAILRASVEFDAPLVIRYPKDGQESAVKPIEFGKFKILHSTTSDIIVYAVGERCLKIANSVLEKCNRIGIDFTIVNARFVKPLDVEFLNSRTENVVFTIEDNVLTGGFGDAILRFYRNSGKKIENFGYHDTFIPHGAVNELMKEFGLDEEEIFDRIVKYARG